MTISFHVPGVPVAQPRVKFNGHRAYTPDKKVGPYKKAIQMQYKLEAKHMTFDGPVYVCMEFNLPMPKYMRRKNTPSRLPHTKKPDVDNICKAAIDALTKAGAWQDDSQVYMLHASKRYVLNDNEVGTHITIVSVT